MASGDELIETLANLASQDGEVSDEVLDEAVKSLEVAAPLPEAVAKDADLTKESAVVDIRAQLGAMKIGDKIKAALLGNSICRGLLITDSNKIIQQCVLRNPRLALPEVENFSKNTNVGDAVLRHIASSKNWMKYYSVKVNIVSNPKTPGDLALKWLRYINKPELKRLSKSKSVPQLIATTAKKRLVDMEDH